MPIKEKFQAPLHVSLKNKGHDAPAPFVARSDVHGLIERGDDSFGIPPGPLSQESLSHRSGGKSRVVPGIVLTLTSSSERHSEAVGQRKARALFAKTGNRFGVDPRCLVWCLRAESGELTGRFHYHALLAGMPDTARNPQTCFWLIHLGECLPPLPCPGAAIRAGARWCGLRAQGTRGARRLRVREVR